MSEKTIAPTCKVKLLKKFFILEKITPFFAMSIIFVSKAS